MTIAGWRVLDQFVIQKGMGHYDFNELLERLIANMEDDGSLGDFPRAMDDIGGGHMVGVEADAAWEAIYQGLITPEEAALVHAGPQPGMEAEYRAALDKAITAGSTTINQAIEMTNAKKNQKYQEDMMAGKDPKEAQWDLPPAFSMDMGKAILSPAWKDGAWGPMDKNKHWILDQWNRPVLRVGNRDQQNKFPESWSRPYQEGLKELRGGGNTREYIESHRVHPNSVYVNIEAKNGIYDLFDKLKAQGWNKGNLTPEILRQHWSQDGILSNHQPHQHTPLQQIYNVRETTPFAQESVDNGEAMVQQANEPEVDPNAYLESFNDEIMQTPRGKHMLTDGHLRNNQRRYSPAMYRQFLDHYGIEDAPSMEELQSQGKNGKLGNLMRGLHELRMAQGQGQPPPADPVPEGLPQGRVPNQAPPEQAIVQPPVEAPVVQPIPQQAPPAQPIPQQALPQPIQQRQPPQSINPQVSAQSPPSQAGWRGMSERIGEMMGRGAANVANFFKEDVSKQQIEDMLESVQCDLAKQDDHVAKMIPYTQLKSDSAADIAFMAGQLERPPSDVVTILNSRGDWREMAKSMDVPIEIIQVVKVAFQ
jgi:hypothetical protein